MYIYTRYSDWPSEVILVLGCVSWAAFKAMLLFQVQVMCVFIGEKRRSRTASLSSLETRAEGVKGVKGRPAPGQPAGRQGSQSREAGRSGIGCPALQNLATSVPARHFKLLECML